MTGCMLIEISLPTPKHNNRNSSIYRAALSTSARATQQRHARWTSGIAAGGQQPPALRLLAFPHQAKGAAYLEPSTWSDLADPFAPLSNPPPESVPKANVAPPSKVGADSCPPALFLATPPPTHRSSTPRPLALLALTASSPIR
ncbi:hypothetical protein K431DRAFT_307825 [Polychaeton citri CBS 116435]|uniref:Uncharacterized protein n=1 Tax=Polychaeton citri CBS 116435 TaxID=1314669 RepID=A0A9P4PYY4_9PEZI|nr:hypothetical protein K431DRAFT_307825 [Polychaeton citri CBS 116435]